VVNCGMTIAAEGVRAVTHDAPILLAQGRSVESLVLLPLVASTRLLGVLALGFRFERPFDAEALATAIDLSTRASIALDNASLFRRIREEDRRKNEFLAMLAHELRNPLAPIGNALH